MSAESVPNEDDLAEMVEQVWMSYLDPEGINPLIRVEEGPPISEVHSSVSISGSWHGHIVYASSQAAANKAAAGFLAMDVDEVGAEDVADVLGEMANIIGGNVKSMLPDGCFLSLPQVVMAPETITRYPSEIRVTGLYGTWEGEPISISMWQSRNDVEKNDVKKEEAA